MHSHIEHTSHIDSLILAHTYRGYSGYNVISVCKYLYTRYGTQGEAEATETSHIDRHTRSVKVLFLAVKLFSLF